MPYQFRSTKSLVKVLFQWCLVMRRKGTDSNGCGGHISFITWSEIQWLPAIAANEKKLLNKCVSELIHQCLLPKRLASVSFIFTINIFISVTVVRASTDRNVAARNPNEGDNQTPLETWLAIEESEKFALKTENHQWFMKVSGQGAVPSNFITPPTVSFLIFHSVHHPKPAVATAITSRTISRKTRLRATMLSVHILPNSPGALFWKPDHLQVHDWRVVTEVFPERWELIVVANIVVKIVVTRQSRESTVDVMLRRWNFGWGYVKPY